MDFNQLSELLKRTSTELVQRSVKAVNVNLTLRNWLFGYYIVEYEQNGEDRAKYGKIILKALAQTLDIKGLGETSLKLCRQFYLAYPEIISLINIRKSQTMLDELPALTLTDGVKSQTVSDQSVQKDAISHFQNLIAAASFNHFTELVKIEDKVKRRFYELFILRTTPSVRELRRQIETLTYERVQLSRDPALAFDAVARGVISETSIDFVKSHYFFEFLNINNPELIEESELERGLIAHLQEFIIELGNGFCFEARQKRILIGDEYFFIDLVFYHRVLKCHILIELKTEWVKHEHIGQLKVYLQHYKRTVMVPDDNPPVGILLVTGKNKTLVEYAVADSDMEIFVSKYQLQLPDKKKLERFIQEELNKM